MKGFFSIELLLIIFLLPFIIYLMEGGTLILFRETEVYTQDIAQMLMYNQNIEDMPIINTAIWIDEIQISECNYNFKYCTHRFYGGGEHKICSAECLQ